MARLWLAVAFLASCFFLAQITGSFSLEKSTFAPGEPVYLSLTLHIGGKQVQEVQTAGPYGFCSGFRIEISRDQNPQPACF